MQSERPVNEVPAVDFGYRQYVLRTRWASVRAPLRLVGISVALFALAVLLGIIALSLGEYPLDLGEVFGALFADGDDFARTVVIQWRMPIVVAAIVFGGLLGIGGAIFQSITRNPLGSPDVIGFDAGSYTAVVIAILVLNGGSSWSLAVAALVGGFGTALVVYALAYRRGIQGFRLTVVGIGVAALLGSINSYLITRADIEGAMTIGFWGAGSLSRVVWPGLAPALLLAVVVVVVVFRFAPDLRSLELGDDASRTHGTAVGRSRLILLLAGVATTALVTAVAGPIGFIALTAPQLAKRLVGSPGVSLLAASAMGAALLSAAHLLSLTIAQFYRPVPVGLITVSLGGVYLVGLLFREARRAGIR